MVGKLDEALRFHETSLALRAQRQQVLASNIANADTPNYKARDIDFNAALKGALSRGSVVPSPALARTSPVHLAGSNTNATTSGAQLLHRTNGQGNVDGNTVDMDAERNQFTDNAVRYEAELNMISTQIKHLLAAVQG